MYLRYCSYPRQIKPQLPAQALYIGHVRRFRAQHEADGVPRRQAHHGEHYEGDAQEHRNGGEEPANDVSSQVSASPLLGPPEGAGVEPAPFPVAYQVASSPRVRQAASPERRHLDSHTLFSNDTRCRPPQAGTKSWTLSLTMAYAHSK